MRTPVTEGTPAVGTPAADEAVTGAWHALLGRIGPPAECRPLANVSLATPDAEEPGTVAMYQLDIRELFVGAGPAKGAGPNCSAWPCSRGRDRTAKGRDRRRPPNSSSWDPRP